MHILLTDVLACPRCGPEFGLILLADEVHDRRVRQGHLGCPNCREEYPVKDGVADLRFADSGQASGPAPAPETSDERALRVAALLGVRTPGARVLVAGAGANLAQQLAQLLPDVEVIALQSAAGETATELGAVSRVAAGSVLPFQSGKLHGAAMLGGGGHSKIADAARVLAPGARLLLEPVSGSVEPELTAAGMHVLLAEAGTVLAVKGGVAHPQTHS